jgi:hypothetical protein
MILAVLLWAALTGPGPADLFPDCFGPATTHPGPATRGMCSNAVTTTTTASTTTTTTLIIPAGGAADVNCPNTIPTQNSTTTSVNTLNAAITCATPAQTTTVLSISFYAATGNSGAHQKCSVYTYPPGYVAATTSVPKVAAGCDTVEWTAPSGTVNAYVTLNVTGTCTLAASTRYMIACNQDLGFFLGQNNTSCTLSGVQCNQQRGSQTYTTTALPDPWTANNQAPVSLAYYLTVR